MNNSHAEHTDAVTKHLSVLHTQGLTESERSKRLEKYGPNALPEPKKPSLLQEFFEQLKNPIVLLLIGVSIIAGATGKALEATLIVSIVLFMAAVGVFLQKQSEKSLEKLKALQNTTATILSHGKVVEVFAQSIVPGDIILLQEGDKVPADARVLEAKDARLDESSLTGESLPVAKHSDRLASETSLGDQKNMVFSGTSVVSGSVKAVVVKTGVLSELGKITQYLNSQETRLTPLQKELEQVGKLLLMLTLISVTVIFAIYIWRGEPLIESLLTTMSLAIAFVPEGLSAVLTVTLALAVKEMVKKQVIVKKLLAAEGLGSITHIATDKTGTITEGRMHVVKVFLRDELFSTSDSRLTNNPSFERLMNVIRFCNNNKGPTEQALVAFLDKHGYAYELEGRLVEYVFTSNHKRMSVVRQHNGKVHLFSKGAPDILIPLCTKDISGNSSEFTPAEKQKALAMAEKLASEGFRVLALADKIQKEHTTPEERESSETELTFIGLVALMDPLRDTVKDTVSRLKSAGVTPMMITGDHPAIARYIAQEAGIIRNNGAETVLTGADLDDLFARSQFPDTRERLLEARVFARVRPEHKVMLVELYQQQGFRIAMTGDGVNDAAAIKRADVGIAMSNGMDVTRDIANVVVTGSYDALIRAVAIGRTVKLRTQLYLHYLLSGNACQVGLFMVAVLFNLPNPLTPVMLLLINVLTDAAPAMAMAVEPEDPEITKRKVKQETEGIVSKQVVRGIFIQGIVSTVLLGAAFYLAYTTKGIVFAQTVAFTLFIFQKALRGFTARSFTRSVLRYGFFSNYLMNLAIPLALSIWYVTVYVFPSIFSMTSLPLSVITQLFLLALILPALEEIMKKLNKQSLVKSSS